MVCPACRKQNPDVNRFCGFCGTPLRADSITHSRGTVAFFRRVEKDQRPQQPESPQSDERLREKSWEENASVIRDQPTDEARLTTSGEPRIPGITDDVNATRYPRPGYDEPATPREPTLARDETLLRPEVIEYDKKIPIIAEPGTDRRHSVNARDAISNKPEPRAPEPTQPPTRRIRVTDRQAAPPSTYGPTSILGLNAPTADEVGVAGDNVSSIPGEYAPHPSITEERPHFLDLSERPADTNSIHGPSFLGIGDDSMVEYDDEELRETHTRRNVALAVLALLVALAALQWRSIRDFGLRYAQNGTMSLHLPKKAQRPADQSATNAQPSDPAAVPPATAPPVATSPAANGKPEIQVEPTTNPNGPKPDTSTNANAGSAQSPTTPPSNAKTDGNAAQPTQTAENRGGDMPQGEPADDDTTDTPEPGPNRTAAPKPVPRNVEEGGAAELAQASSIGDPAQQSVWLWKAVGKGNSEASVRLADLYLDGRGVGQNCDQAMVLLKSAANKKSARARSRLGSLYATGKCVPQDRVAAYHWMTMALQADPGSEWVSHNRQMLWGQMSDSEKQSAARER